MFNNLTSEILTGKTISQEKATIYVAIFVIFSLNFQLLEAIFLPTLTEYRLLVLAYLTLSASLLAILLLIISTRITIKPILTILLIVSSFFSYMINNFDLILAQNILAELNQTGNLALLKLINFKILLYLLVFGVLPSYFVLTTELELLEVKTIFLLRIKAIFYLLLCCIFLVVGLVKFIDFPLKDLNPLRVHFINIAKATTPLKNLLLKRDIHDRISLIRKTGNCSFCNLSYAEF